MARRSSSEPRAARHRDGPRSATPPPSKSPPARRRMPWIAAGIVLAALVIYVGGVQSKRAFDAARLPPLPDLAAQRRPIADHLRDADRAARADPGSAAAVGALCVAYHA